MSPNVSGTGSVFKVKSQRFLNHEFLVSGEVDYEAQSESVYSVEEDLSAQDLVDFSPVYRCLHIHTVLVRVFAHLSTNGIFYNIYFSFHFLGCQRNV